jgi:hypothetical protein
MPDPYAGAVGYNLALDDAIRRATEIIEAEANGDERLLEIGAKIVTGIAGLHRKRRFRRTSAELRALRSAASSNAKELT